MLLLRSSCRLLIEGLIGLVLQIPALHGLQDFICLAVSSRVILVLEGIEHLIQQSLRHIIGTAVDGPDLGICVLGIHAERDIGGQCPGRCRPCQEIRIFIRHLESHNGRALLERLVALRHFMRGQRCSAAGAVGHDLKALVEEPLLPDLLERPPLGLDIVVVVGHIRVVHIRPETDDAGEILPHRFVFPDTLLALLDKGRDAVFLDLLLALDADLLLDFQLHGKSVGIPSGLSGNLISLHRAVARHHVLDDSCQNMADMGLSVRRGRAVIKHICRAALALLHALFKDLIVFPEFQCVVFSLHEIQVGIYLFVHLSPSAFLVSLYRMDETQNPALSPH